MFWMRYLQVWCYTNSFLLQSITNQPTFGRCVLVLVDFDIPSFPLKLHTNWFESDAFNERTATYCPEKTVDVRNGFDHFVRTIGIEAGGLIVWTKCDVTSASELTHSLSLSLCLLSILIFWPIDFSWLYSWVLSWLSCYHERSNPESVILLPWIRTINQSEVREQNQTDLIPKDSLISMHDYITPLLTATEIFLGLYSRYPLNGPKSNVNLTRTNDQS